MAVRVGGFWADNEFLVNGSTFFIQDSSVLAALSGGGFVALWRSYSGGAKGQVFTDSGAKVGAEFALPDSGSDEPAVRALADGGFAVSWVRASDGAVLVQLHTATGAPDGDAIVAAEAGEAHRAMTQLQPLADGILAVAWSEMADSGQYTIRLQLIGADGALAGSDILVSAGTASQYRPQIAALADGGFVVTWMDNGVFGSAAESDMRGQVFDAAGTRIDTPFVLDGDPVGAHSPGTVAPLPTGGFVAVWPHGVRNASGVMEYSIEAQIFDATGARVGKEIVVSAATPGAKHTPALLVLEGGFLLFAWTDFSAAGDGSGAVKARLFDAAGVAVGAEFLVNEVTTGVQGQPELASLGGGGFVVSWTDGSGIGGDSSYEGIKARIFTPAALAADDALVAAEADILTGSLFADNGAGADGEGAAIAGIDGLSVSVGQTIALASGALLTVQADGTYIYDPNGRFGSMPAPSTGAANGRVTDSFTYTLTTGASATVTIVVEGTSGAGDRLLGSAGDDAIAGSGFAETYFLDQGGDDHVHAGDGNDGLYFGAALTAADRADGGAGSDQLALQGDYGLLLGAENLLAIESLVLLSGSDMRFGASGAERFDYVLTTVDGNVAAGQTLTVTMNGLEAGEDVTFDGSAETDGSFLFYGGGGIDTLIGGARGDAFFFGASQFAATDRIVGGGGADQLGLRGNYTVVFGADTISGVESLALLSGKDTRFGAAGPDYSYDLTFHDANVAAGSIFSVAGSSLGAGESLVFDGSGETDGSFRIFAGLGADDLSGGAGNDFLYGNGGGDRLNGGGGADVFAYRSAQESTSTGFDTLVGFDWTSDRIDLPGSGYRWNGDGAGKLDLASFDADLAAAAAGLLTDAKQAALLTASSGDMAGRSFLVVDGNGIAGYQAGEDYVFEIVGAAPPPAELTGAFIV